VTEPGAGEPRIRVVLADDQALVRTGFRLILDSEPGIEVVDAVSDGAAAVAAVHEHRPDVVLMDVQMPVLDGLAATRQIACPATRVIILTTFERDEYIFEALRSGASGFLLKNSPPEDLIAAVRLIAAGEALLAPSVTRRIIERFAAISSRPPPEPAKELRFLTEREVEVLCLLASGKSNAELASALFVGEATVKTHVSRVLTKLNLRDRVQAVVFAYESGLVTPGSSAVRLTGDHPPA